MPKTFKRSKGKLGESPVYESDLEPELEPFLSLHLKLGNHEFDATGSEDFIAEYFEKWLNIAGAKHGTSQESTGEPSSGS